MIAWGMESEAATGEAGHGDQRFGAVVAVGTVGD